MKKSNLFLKGKGISSHIPDMLISVIAIVLDVVVFNLLGNTLSEYKLWSIAIFVVLFVVIAFILIWFVATHFLTQIHYSDGRRIDTQCLYNNFNCCGIAVCNSISQHYSLTLSQEDEKKLETDYSLYVKPQIVDKEVNFKSQDGKEIWIISDNLNSEISEGSLPNYVKNNLENDIKYNFVFLKEEECSSVKRNKEKILEGLSKPENVVFYPLGTNEADLNTYIVYLFGIVIYEYDKFNYEGYFSLRNYSSQQQIEPIYLKMPQCMADKYMDIFHSIKQTDKMI